MAETKLENRHSKTEAGKKGAVRDFVDLDAWKLARQLRQAIYDLTKKLPPEEKHVLTAQLRRAAISVTANIAEGFGRFSYQENVQYCRQARGSVYELRDHLTTVLDNGHLSRDHWREADRLAQRVTQVLNGYIRSTQARQRDSARR
jgi:four helix bundle protein